MPVSSTCHRWNVACQSAAPASDDTVSDPMRQICQIKSGKVSPCLKHNKRVKLLLWLKDVSSLRVMVAQTSYTINANIIYAGA